MPLMSKGDFARLYGKKPSAVSNWISKGLLTPPALVGSGNKAKIDHDLAVQQLGSTLDISQQMAQPRPILPGGPVAIAAETAPANTDQAEYLRIRKDRAALALARERAEEEEAAGRWVPTDQARDAFAGEIATLHRHYETWLATTLSPELVTLIRSNPGLTLRDIQQAMKTSQRQMRERVSLQAREKADQLPRHVASSNPNLEDDGEMEINDDDIPDAIDDAVRVR